MLFDESLALVVGLLGKIQHAEIEWVVEDLFTPSEIVELWERIALLRQLKAWSTQRTIASDLGISVTTVSRWSRVLKYGRWMIEKYL